MPKRIMLDLETMGTRPGCAILQIGAVEFCATAGLGREFYSRISLIDCQRQGLEIDADTVNWWLAREENARAEVVKPGGDRIAVALSRFHVFLSQVCQGRVDKRGGFEVEVWGNSSTFDNAILTEAFLRIPDEGMVAFGIPAHSRGAPWGRYNDRCYRTLKNLFRDVPEPLREGVHHNAVDDAKHQARHCIELLKRAARCGVPVGEPGDQGHGQGKGTVP